ncbi:MAG TPA: hypothetical protein VMX35_08025 [Acidobacteriota bacterium]|nr:hypothetical protein [Acidobacteriota bacterium]
MRSDAEDTSIIGDRDPGKARSDQLKPWLLFFAVVVSLNLIALYFWLIFLG